MHEAKHLVDDLKQRRQEAQQNLGLAIEQIGNLKARRVELISELRRINETPIAKDDFIEFILKGIDKQGKAYPDLLLSHIHNITRSHQVILEYIDDFDESHVVISEPLLGSGDPYQINKAALYYVFAEPIKAATRRILEEGLELGNGEKISRAYATARKFEIQTELAAINKTLDDLVETAESFGYVDPDKFPVESEDERIKRENAQRWGLDRVQS
jgi:coenzyme F420-reducing hydrogenase alpha subunit